MKNANYHCENIMISKLVSHYRHRIHELSQFEPYRFIAKPPQMREKARERDQRESKVCVEIIN